MNPRGTRPKQAQRWPRRAEQYRMDADEAAAQIDRLARKVSDLGQLDPLVRREMLADIRYLAASIRMWMAQAANGIEHEE
jgi:hypothetical protein